ncbi:amidohydrolase [Clostridium sp. D2Q-14]|uniref:amidohydrolase n=1 Tax=Anaeromonas gelatinilytica TaxID=2683194 RepID=UPI00193BB6EC|nr:amidohydrolase [Anaeromonas gelatinilytica]MBS4536420.1 amidohydrolase [Anaeromonas gelatinilytica]
MKDVDLILYNGNIVTIDSSNSIFDWILIKDGKIFDLGKGNKYKKYLNDNVEAIDIEGKAVLPGFYDSHVHLVQTGLNLLSVDLSDVRSISELQETISKRAKETPKGQLIRGVGYDDFRIKEGRMPTRYELDKCTTNHSVWINRVEYHISSLNSKALNSLNIPFDLEGIIRDERNLPDGRLVGNASAYIRGQIFNRISNKRRKKGVFKAIDLAIKKGVTTIGALEGGFSFHNKDAEFIIDNKNAFPIDVNLFYQTIDVERVLKNRLNRIGGCIFLDGSFGSRNAALSQDYSDDEGNKGKLFFKQEELNNFVLKAHKNNLQITVHAIGDRAIEQILLAYEYALGEYPRIDHRHRIEHFELPSDEHIERAKKLGLVLSMQPAYEHYWGEEGDLYDRRLGDRRKTSNPLKKILDNGLLIAGGSDSDVTAIDPLLGIYTAVNHPNKEYSLDVLEAIKLFTINGAYAVFEEDIKGSIEKGKYGDLVILDKNPLKIDKKEIKNIEVVGTIKEGNILYIK